MASSERHGSTWLSRVVSPPHPITARQAAATAIQAVFTDVSLSGYGQLASTTQSGPRAA